ncbi:MAG: competence/damage-inducible protein A [Candidatus Aminicenantes bacterium]|nr:competence/damage-inducible protein A [Candidatus Aminicenantes bacterium]
MKAKKDFKIEIMAVGSELLTPYFQDTNSLFLTERLNDLGMEVSYKTIVGDDWDDLALCIKQALSRAHIIIAMGGLGPTKDDRTREAFATVLERKLIFNKELLQRIEERFKRRGLSMPEVNKKQSYVIEGAESLKNRNGTAPGLWLDTGSNKIVLLPGPPHELKPMFEESVMPHLQKHKMDYKARKLLKITGLTESKIETLILDLYPDDPDLRLTTLAHPGQIEIHLSSHSIKSQEQADKRLQKLEKDILERLKENVFSTTGEELEEVVGNLLRQNKKTLAVAESCTGGLIGNRLTDVPGSSDYFLQGVVAYSNQAKINALGVSPELIEKHGAVSAQVAEAMSQGIREKAHSSLGIGVTGIAGPAGGTREKPVGLVYIALAWDKGLESIKNIFLGNRDKIKYQSSQKALDMVRRHLIKYEKKKTGMK